MGLVNSRSQFYHALQLAYTLDLGMRRDDLFSHGCSGARQANHKNGFVRLVSKFPCPIKDITRRCTQSVINQRHKFCHIIFPVKHLPGFPEILERAIEITAIFIQAAKTQQQPAAVSDAQISSFELLADFVGIG